MAHTCCLHRFRSAPNRCPHPLGTCLAGDANLPHRTLPGNSGTALHIQGTHKLLTAAAQGLALQSPLTLHVAAVFC